MQPHTHLLTRTYKETQWHVRTQRHTCSYARLRTAERDVLLMHTHLVPNARLSVFLKAERLSRDSWALWFLHNECKLNELV